MCQFPCTLRTSASVMRTHSRLRSVLSTWNQPTLFRLLRNSGMFQLNLGVAALRWISFYQRSWDFFKINFLRVQYQMDSETEGTQWRTHPVPVQAHPNDRIEGDQRMVSGKATVALQPFGHVSSLFIFSRWAWAPFTSLLRLLHDHCSIAQLMSFSTFSAFWPEMAWGTAPRRGSKTCA